MTASRNVKQHHSHYLVIFGAIGYRRSPKRTDASRPDSSLFSVFPVLSLERLLVATITDYLVAFFCQPGFDDSQYDRPVVGGISVVGTEPQ